LSAELTKTHSFMGSPHRSTLLTYYKSNTGEMYKQTYRSEFILSSIHTVYGNLRKISSIVWQYIYQKNVFRLLVSSLAYI